MGVLSGKLNNNLFIQNKWGNGSDLRIRIDLMGQMASFYAISKSEEETRVNVLAPLK